MRAGWLTDRPNYVGGAEITQRMLRQCAPESIEIVSCPPGGVVGGLDVYLVHNVVEYELADLERIGGQPVIWYHHDLSPWIAPDVRGYFDERARHIFCSPLQAEHYPTRLAGFELIPPAMDLDRFRPQGPQEREGALSIAQWRGHGKGGQQLHAWARKHGKVDVYGVGELFPRGGSLIECGPLEEHQVAETLWRYRCFVFLPTAIEPFGRCVAEAWAAGCNLVVNGNVGALHWIKEDAGRLDTAGSDYWKAVLS